MSDEPFSEYHEEPDGFTWGVCKLDRRVDPYLAGVTFPDKTNSSGLCATIGEARSWCRKLIAQKRSRFPSSST